MENNLEIPQVTETGPSETTLENVEKKESAYQRDTCTPCLLWYYSGRQDAGNPKCLSADGQVNQMWYACTV